ncbi:MAG: OmpA family protein [Parvibaculaceae bacterium]
MKRATTRVTALAVASTFTLVACTSTDPYTGEEKTNNATIGAGIGALAGAVGGALIGGGDWRKRALIGAGVGALAGGGIGYYMDQQEAKLRQRLQATGVSVTRVGNDIILNMPGNVTFATGSADINSGFYDVLDSVAIVLEEYESTLVDIYGHTDSDGAADYNQQLSERRAQSVARYLTSRGIRGDRLLVRGLGESQPIASNATAAGKAQNRRVEIRISPLTA